jgi:23S rRNA (guanosine2251-2'-O)-methyltransferase
MAGNSQRRGARRDETKKKGPSGGSGGQRRRGLEGKGPTPKASERKGHAKSRAKKAADKRAATGRRPGTRGAGGGARKTTSEIVFGRNAVVEALRAKVPVTALYVASKIDADERVREALKIATSTGLPLLEAPRGELDRLADGGPHQGLLLQIPPYEYSHPDELIDAVAEADEAGLVVALDGVTDPRNLGAIVRSTAAFGGHGIIVPERRSAGMTAGAWKASAGAAVRVPVARAKNLTRTLNDFQEAGFLIVGLAVDGAIDLDELDLDPGQSVVVVVGSEGKGLTRLVTETCDQLVRIPMAREVESLNASVATSIVVHELSKRRTV